MRAQPPAVKGIDIILEPTRDLRHFVVMVSGDMTIPISMSEHWRWQDSEALREETVLCYQDRLEIRNIVPIGPSPDGVTIGKNGQCCETFGRAEALIGGEVPR